MLPQLRIAGNPAEFFELPVRRDQFKGLLALSQIAILSPCKYRKSVVAGIRGASVPLAEISSDWPDNRLALFSTIRSFKALEAGAVFRVEIGEVDSSQLFISQLFMRNDFYVDCSRANTS